MHNLSKKWQRREIWEGLRLCLPGSQYNKELLILNMIPAKFPSQIWITISSAAFGISYTDRLVANFLKEQASKAEFRKLLSSDFLRITNKIRSNKILQSSIKHFPFVRIINICRRLIFVMRSMIDCVATECFDIDKINYIFIMRFEKKKLYCAWRQIDSFPPPAFNYN